MNDCLLLSSSSFQVLSSSPLLFKIFFCSRSFVGHEEVHDRLVVLLSGVIQRSVSSTILQVEVRISLEQFSDSGLFSPSTSNYQRSVTTSVLCVYLCIGLQEQWYHCVVTIASRLDQSSPAVLREEGIKEEYGKMRKTIIIQRKRIPV